MSTILCSRIPQLRTDVWYPAKMLRKLQYYPHLIENKRVIGYRKNKDNVHQPLVNNGNFIYWTYGLTDSQEFSIYNDSNELMLVYRNIECKYTMHFPLTCYEKVRNVYSSL